MRVNPTDRIGSIRVAMVTNFTPVRQDFIVELIDCDDPDRGYRVPFSGPLIPPGGFEPGQKFPLRFTAGVSRLRLPASWMPIKIHVSEDLEEVSIADSR
jgi:hypothetical protein